MKDKTKEDIKFTEDKFDYEPVVTFEEETGKITLNISNLLEAQKKETIKAQDEHIKTLKKFKEFIDELNIIIEHRNKALQELNHKEDE